MRYSTGAIVLHWLLAVLIALNYAAAWVAEDMPKAEAMQIMGNHKAIGMTILALTIIRIIWRITHRAVPFSSTIKPWEAALARLTHSLLYVLMMAIPLMGWALHSAFSGGKPIPFFGLFNYSGLPMVADKSAGQVFEAWHGNLATVLLVLAAVHVLAALKHQFLDRDGIMARMGIGKPRA